MTSADVDDASAQLHLDLRSDVQTALATRRPVLHHLNADTSWFLQIPRPPSAARNGERGGRFYYNILIDPWLFGGQSDVASWFSQQFHPTPSAVPTIAALEELARETEILANGLRLGVGRPTNVEDALETESLIDAVAVSHEFTDHCNKENLIEIHPDVPVFAIRKAASLIDSWKHFRTVVTVDTFGLEGNTDWRTTSIPPLPDWIGISRLLQKEDVLNYHAALMITFNNGPPASSNKSRPNAHHKRRPSTNSEPAEAIIYTPHGIYSKDLDHITQASPPIHTLAFLHGLHNVRVGTVSGRTALQSNLGAHNGLKAQRMLKARYWIGTHDEIKKGGGLVSWFLQYEKISLKEALEREKGEVERGNKGADAGVVNAFEGVNWVELGNGHSRVLV